MTKKKEETTTSDTEILGYGSQIDEQQIAIAEKWQLVELKTSLLTMSKEILERNAALKWEQDKTKGLEVTPKDIINSAKQLLKFVLG